MKPSEYFIFRANLDREIMQKKLSNPSNIIKPVKPCGHKSTESYTCDKYPDLYICHECSISRL